MTRVGSRRAGTLAAALLICIGLIGARLVYVQGVRAGGYVTTAHKEHIRRIELPARRGTIYDRRGGELAVSVPARTVYANPKLVKDPTATAQQIAPLLGRPVASVDADLRSARGFVYLARRIGTVSAQKIEDFRLPGIGVVDEPRRVYPGASLAANVVGFIGTDQQGLNGLEFGYEKLLGGRPGYRVLEQDPLGRRIPQGMFTQVPPVPGSDLVLTLDPDIELVAERALAAGVQRTHAKGGMLVMLDPHTGEIFAMANNPTYDPNDVRNVKTDDTRNRVVTDAYEPGSVNKIVMAAAALTEGILKPGQHIYVPGALHIGDTTFTDARTPPGSYDLEHILAVSSNLGTMRIAQMVGADTMESYFRRFGYGVGTGLGFPGESPGFLPPMRWATSLPTMAIGQGISVTALQLAQIYASAANDGVVAEPRLVNGWIDPKGDVHRSPVSRGSRVLSTQVAVELRRMLKSVVDIGTGRQAQFPGYTIAGKTGTARKVVPGIGYQGYFGSFVGMVPASHPRFVMAVVLDDPTPIEGGLSAAPVFSEVARQAVHILRMPPGS